MIGRAKAGGAAASKGKKAAAGGAAAGSAAKAAAAAVAEAQDDAGPTGGAVQDGDGDVKAAKKQPKSAKKAPGLLAGVAGNSGALDQVPRLAPRATAENENGQGCAVSAGPQRLFRAAAAVEPSTALCKQSSCCCTSQPALTPTTLARRRNGDRACV